MITKRKRREKDKRRRLNALLLLELNWFISHLTTSEEANIRRKSRSVLTRGRNETVKEARARKAESIMSVLIKPISSTPEKSLSS